MYLQIPLRHKNAKVHRTARLRLSTAIAAGCAKRYHSSRLPVDAVSRGTFFGIENFDIRGIEKFGEVASANAARVHEKSTSRVDYSITVFASLWDLPRKEYLARAP
jgi:hypothetical protein